MQNILNKYDDLFSSQITSIQFAKNGIWEEAWSFNIEKIPTNEELHEYLNNCNEIAIELFCGISFVGFRFEGTSESVKSFSQHCLGLIKSKETNLKDFIFGIEKYQSNFSFFDEISFLEIGALNAWKKIPSYKIPIPYNIEKVILGFYQTELAKDTFYPKALEIAFKKPISHWIGIQLSEEKLNNIIQEKKLFKVLDNVDLSKS